MNPVWREVYAVLLKCRKPMLMVKPEEYITFLINGKPDLASNHTGIQQGWSRNLILHKVLNNSGKLKEFEELTIVHGPLRMEYNALKAAVGEKSSFKKLTVIGISCFLWKFMYSLKFAYAYRGLIQVAVEMHITHSYGDAEILIRFQQILNLSKNHPPTRHLTFLTAKYVL